jgi:hypothetical protein
MATRRDLLDPSNPEQLRLEQRLAEVTATLAAGVIRMRAEQSKALPRFRSCRNSVHRGDVGRVDAPPGHIEVSPGIRRNSP